MIPTEMFHGDLSMTREMFITPIGEVRLLISRKSWLVPGLDEEAPPVMPYTDFVVIAHHPDTGVMTMRQAKLEAGSDVRTLCANAVQDLSLSVQAIKAYLKGFEGSEP